MSPKSELLLLIIVLLSFCVCWDYVQVSGTGTWRKFTKSNTRNVREYAKFAVREHNRVSHTHLKLQSVIEGASLVDGPKLNIKLVIKAKDGATDHKYSIKMYEESWRKSITLTSFTKID